MESELSLRPRWAALAVVMALAAPTARAQSAFELLASGPELGGQDVPRELPRRLPVAPPPGRLHAEAAGGGTEDAAQAVRESGAAATESAARAVVASGSTSEDAGDVVRVSGDAAAERAARAVVASAEDTARAVRASGDAAAERAARAVVASGSTSERAGYVALAAGASSAAGVQVVPASGAAEGSAQVVQAAGAAEGGVHAVPAPGSTEVSVSGSAPGGGAHAVPAPGSTEVSAAGSAPGGGAHAVPEAGASSVPASVSGAEARGVPGAGPMLGTPPSPLTSPGLMPLSPLQPRASFHVLPAAASLMPGLLFHGLGPWLAGDGHTAKKLFALEGTGLGLIALGGVPIAFTGASRRTIAPLYAVTLAGFSLFGISALANLYSVTSPAFDPGVPPPSLPPLELELGYQYVNDPAFEYGHFVSLGVLTRLDAVRLEASARMAPDEGNTQVRLGGAYRLLGESERARGASDGTALDAELFGLFHRFPTEGFTVAGGEVGLRGRYAMARLSPALAGSFAEASLGTSFQGYSYPGAVDEGNLHEQLLFSFGYGVWLGRGGPVKGEALLYYDHRKDGFAGGMRTRGGGVIGSFGLRGRALLTEDWGVAAEVQAGGAVVGRLSLVYTVGGEP